MSPRSLIRSALVLGLIAAALPAAAADLRFEVQGGRSFVDSHGANTAFLEVVFAPQPLGRTGLTWSPDVSLGWIDGRHITNHSQDRYTDRDSVALVAAGARFHAGPAGAWYQPLFFSAQLAATNHTTNALSSHYQFVSTLGWQAQHFSIALRHISNGGLHEPNGGETMAVVGLAFDI